MNDLTEAARKKLIVEEINAEPGSREALEAKYGQVWDTKELQRDYTVLGFMAPLIAVVRKSDNVKGSLHFQHDPRYYFDFQEHKP